MATPVGSILVNIEANDTPALRVINGLASKSSRAINGAISAGSFQALGKITGQSNEFQKSLAASNARVIAFGASAGSIFAVKSAFDRLVESTIQVEKELTEIDSILQLGSTNLQRFATSLFATANAASVAFGDAAKAATEFSRQGLSVEDTLKRTAAALSLSRLASIDVGEAVSSLTSILNSFTRESLVAEDVVNRLTSVDASYAISADDLAKALSRVSASANDANIAFNETISLVTSAQQITSRGGSVIGNAFKSIFTRLQRPQVLDDLEAAGVSVRDLQGKVLPMVTVLRNLAGSYDTLSSSQKSFVSETVGGVYQVNILKAVLKDVGSGLSIFDGAMNAAGNSAGSTERRLKTLNGTISSQLVRTMNELSRASSNVGESLLAPGLKSGVGGFESILKGIGNVTDKNATKEGSATSQLGANVVQGALRGVGNIIQGPGVQFIVLTLMKLFERLEKFIVDSAKDISGVNDKEKQRLAVNKSVVEYLGSQKDMLQEVLSGTISINQVTESFVENLKNANAYYQQINQVANAVTSSKNFPNISISKVGGAGFAEGYIPNVHEEIQGARHGGYTAGRVLQTQINTGYGYMPAIVNGAETKASLVGPDGKTYDFVNPPKDSLAGRKHRTRSLSKTGIDPYDLPQSNFANGSVPSIEYKGVRGYKLRNDETGSFVQFTDTKKGNNIDIINMESRKKGDAYALFKELVIRANLSGKNIRTGGFNPQDQNLELASLDETNYGNLLKIYPQLRYRDIPGLKTSGQFETFIGKDSAKVKFNSLEDLETQVNGMDSGEFYKNLHVSSLKKVSSGFAEGYVPNMPTIEDVEMRLKAAGIEDWRLKGRSKDAQKFTLDRLPPNLLNSVVGRYANSPEDILFLLRSFSRKANTVENATANFGPEGKYKNPKELYNLLRGAITNPAGAGYLNDLRNPDNTINEGAIENFVADMSGMKFQSPKAIRTAEQEFSALSPDLVKMMLDRYASSFKTVAAYESISDLSVPQDRPDLISPLKVGDNTYQIPTGIFGHKTFMRDNYQKIRQAAIQLGGYDQNVPDSELSSVFGFAFNSQLKNQARKEGISSENENIAIDIPGNAQSIIRETNIRGPISGIELKSSAVEALKRGELAGKIFRTLAGNPSDNAAYGPPEHVPLLANIPIFDAKQGGVGLLDADHFETASRKDYLTAVYAAIAKGKGLEIFHGFKGSGQGGAAYKKATTANQSDQDPYVRSLADIDKFQQFIMKSNALVNVTRDVVGLAFSSASSIKGFMPTPDDNYSPEQVEQYNKVVSKLKNKFGSRYTSQYATGRVPNLSMEDAMDNIRFHSNQGKLLNEVAGRARTFVANTTAIQGIGGTPMDREYLISALTSGVIRKSAGPSDLKIIESTMGIGSSMFDVLLEGFKGQIGADELVKRVNMGEFSNGYIAEALKAENKATGGHAKLSRSSLLKTSDNPQGWAAIDNRSQRSADEAVAQHLNAGQSMSEIKVMRSAGGHVPNLALGDGVFSNSSIANSVILALTSFGSNLVTSNEKMDQFKSGLGGLISVQEHNAIKIRAIGNSYDKAKDELLNSGSTVWNNQTYGRGEYVKMESDFKDIMDKINTPAQRAYQESRERNQENTRRFGQRAAIGTAFFGGIGTQFAERLSPRFGAAVEEMTAGATLAGQSLVAFPNLLGKALGAGAIATAVVSAFDVFSKGLANARRDYDVSQGKFQKLSAQIDGIAVALNNFENMMNDSSVSLESLVREERKYSELLGQLGQSETGRKAVAQIAGAPDNRSKIARLQEFRDSEARGLDRQATLLNVKEYASKRTFNVLGQTIGTDALGYSNFNEKNEVNQLTRSATTTAIGALDNDTKNQLLKVVDTPEEFIRIAKDSQGDFRDFLSSLEKILGRQNTGKILDSIRDVLSTEQSYTSPEGQSNLKGLKQRNSERQLVLDSALRRESSTRRLFLNQGSMRVNNNLDVRAIADRNNLNNKMLSLAKKQADGGIFQLAYGERSNRSYQSSLESQRIGAERDFKVKEVNTRTNRSVAELLTENFDDYLKNADMTKNLGAAGQTNINTVSEFRSGLIEALNRGISSTLGRGDVSRFQEQGVFNPEKMFQAISSSSSFDDRTQKSVLDFLRNNNSVDILKLIEGANNELVSINQEALTENQKQTIALQGFLAEADFKQLSSFMGGVKNLLDRQGRRSTEREATRSLAFLRRGTTAEVRGIGGAGLLDFFKKMNVPINLKGNSPLSKLMKEAFEAASKGLRSTQQASIGRIIGSVGRLNGQKDSTVKGFADFANVDLEKASVAALLSEYKPENDSLTKEANKTIDVNTTEFNMALSTSSEDLRKFGNTINVTSRQLMEVIASTSNIRSGVEKARLADEKATQDRVERAGKRRRIREDLEKARNVSPVSTFDSLKGGLTDASDEDIGQGKGSSIPWASMIPQGAGIAAAILYSGWSNRRMLRGLTGPKNNDIPPNFIQRYRNSRTENALGPKLKNTVGRARDFLAGYSSKKAPEIQGPFRPIVPDFTEPQYGPLTAEKKSRGQGPYSPYPKDPRGFNFSTKTDRDMRRAAQQQNKPKKTYFEMPASYENQNRNMTALEEIRTKGAYTRKDVQRIFPSTSKEQASELLNKAYPERAAMNPQQMQEWQKQQQTNYKGKMIPLSQQKGTPGMPSNQASLGFAAGGYGGGGFKSAVGSLATTVGLQYAGDKVGGAAGNALFLSSFLAPQALSSLGGLKGLGGLAKGGLSLGGLGVAGSLGVGALAAGTAYGGYKVGQFAYKKASGMDKVEEDLEAGLSNLGEQYRNYIIDSFSKGKSEGDIKNYLTTQLNSNQESIKTAGGGGLYSSLTGQGQITESLKAANEDIKALIDNLSDIKDETEEKKRNKEIESKQLAILDQQQELLKAQTEFFKSGGAAGKDTAPVTTNLKIEISLKDADKVPESIAEKLIAPLKQQLSNLQTQTNTLINQQNPQPSQV